jgi:hypothetical protein
MKFFLEKHFVNYFFITVIMCISMMFSWIAQWTISRLLWKQLKYTLNIVFRSTC